MINRRTMKTKSNDHTQSMDTSLDINRSKEQNVKKIDNPYQVITQQQKGINLCVLNYLVSSYLTHYTTYRNFDKNNS